MSQAVRILFHDTDGVIAVGAMGGGRTGSPDIVALEEQHDLSDDTLLVPAPSDPFLAGRADARHVGEALRLVSTDLEDSLTKCPDELTGKHRTDARDES